MTRILALALALTVAACAPRDPLEICPHGVLSHTISTVGQIGGFPSH